MFEKLYACLLYLYPARFRKAHGQDALQLLRDRLHEEIGFFQRTRLWFDIFLDLAISLPCLHLNARDTLATSHPLGSSMFLVLEDQPIRPIVHVSACALTLVAYALMALLSHRSDVLRGANSERAHAREKRTPARRTPDKPDAQPTPVEPSNGTASVNRSVFDPERQRVFDAVITNLKQHYFDPAVANRTVEALLADQRRGDDAVATDQEFAAVLTTQMRETSHDLHLEVIYDPTLIPQASPELSASMQKSPETTNCGFKKIETLPHNIGYFKLDALPDPSACGADAADAMTSLNSVNALIFDLRDNRGGTSEMVSLLSSYLFDRPEYLFDLRRVPTLQSWTSSPVAGSRLGNKPVYILTSHTTISAAEQFTYDLQKLNRATIIGEVTAGGAHAGIFHRIDDHYERVTSTVCRKVI